MLEDNSIDSVASYVRLMKYTILLKVLSDDLILVASKSNPVDFTSLWTWSAAVRTTNKAVYQHHSFSGIRCHI